MPPIMLRFWTLLLIPYVYRAALTLDVPNYQTNSTTSFQPKSWLSSSSGPVLRALKDANTMTQVSLASSVSVEASPVTPTVALDEEASGIPYVQTVVSIIVPCAFGLIVFIGVVGNSLIIYIILSNAKMQSVTNILILNLAVADLSFIIVCVPFTAIVYSLFSWPFGTAACKLYQFMINVCAYASVYTLVLMSLDRYLAVVYPVESISIRVPRNTWRAALITWVVVLGINSPILYLYHSIPYAYASGKFVCAIAVDGQEYTKGARILYALFFVLAYVLPLTLIVVLYLGLLKRLWRTGGVGKEFKDQPPPTSCELGVASNGLDRAITHKQPATRRTTKVRTKRSAESIKSKRKVTRMVTIVVVTFALCWLPNNIIFLIIHFGYYPESLVFIVIQISAQCLAYMNSCINPILYAFLSDNYRKAFCNILGKIPLYTALFGRNLNGGTNQRPGAQNIRNVSNLKELPLERKSFLLIQSNTSQFRSNSKFKLNYLKSRDINYLTPKRATRFQDHLDEEIADFSLIDSSEYVVNPSAECEETTAHQSADLTSKTATTKPLKVKDSSSESTKEKCVILPPRPKLNAITYDDEDRVFDV